MIEIGDIFILPDFILNKLQEPSTQSERIELYAFVVHCL